LHSLPFGSIKIDQRFVNGYSGDEKAKSVKLRPLGCQKAQGYYFHRPAEFASFRCETGHSIIRMKRGMTERKRTNLPETAALRRIKETIWRIIDARCRRCAEMLPGD
jgi:hypothetical protein